MNGGRALWRFFLCFFGAVITMELGFLECALGLPSTVSALCNNPLGLKTGNVCKEHDARIQGKISVIGKMWQTENTNSQVGIFWKKNYQNFVVSLNSLSVFGSSANAMQCHPELEGYCFFSLKNWSGKWLFDKTVLAKSIVVQRE